MTEEAKTAVTEQDLGNPAATPQAEASQESATTEAPTEGSKEFNFRALEQKNADAEARLRETEAMNKELIGMLKQGKEPQQPPMEEVLPQLNPDDIPEWSHVEKYVTKAVEKGVQAKLAKQEKDRLPQLVKDRYQDFEEIVTAERVKQLEQENPELAEGLSHSKDPYTATYKYLKAIHKPKKQDPVAMEEAEKILENSSKPISSNAVGQQSALKNANNFQRKSKEQLYKEMSQYASQA